MMYTYIYILYIYIHGIEYIYTHTYMIHYITNHMMDVDEMMGWGSGIGTITARYNGLTSR